MNIEVNQILLQLLNFGILVVALGALVFKPIQKILDSRSTKIAEGMAAAEKSLKEAAAVEEKKAAELSKAAKKAAAIVAEAKEESKKAGLELIESAKAASARELEKQKLAFMEDLHKEELELKKRLTGLVVETTRRTLADSLKPADLKAITAKEIARLK